MPRTRRELIKSIGVGLGALAVARPVLAGEEKRPTSGPDLGELRSTLRSQRDRIRTLHLVFDVEIQGTEGWSEEARWVMQGRRELSYKAPGMLWLVSHREGMISTELLQGDRFFSGMESPDGSRPEKIVYDGPAGPRHKPGMSVDLFLPTPEDKPMYDLGSFTLPDAQTKVIGQNDRRYYVTFTEPVLVRRLERFITDSRLGAQVDFLDYESLDSGLLFPRTLLSKEFDQEGKPKSPVRFSVAEVQVNKPLPQLATAFREKMKG